MILVWGLPAWWFVSIHHVLRRAAPGEVCGDPSLDLPRTAQNFLKFAPLLLFWLVAAEVWANFSSSRIGILHMSENSLWSQAAQRIRGIAAPFNFAVLAYVLCIALLLVSEVRNTCALLFGKLVAGKPSRPVLLINFAGILALLLVAGLIGTQGIELLGWTFGPDNNHELVPGWILAFGIWAGLCSMLLVRVFVTVLGRSGSCPIYPRHFLSSGMMCVKAAGIIAVILAGQWLLEVIRSPLCFGMNSESWQPHIEDMVRAADIFFTLSFIIVTTSMTLWLAVRLATRCNAGKTK